MKNYVVYHLIHVNTPHQHNPKLVVTGVPNDVDLTTEDVDRGGYQFGEFNRAWCNYYLEEIEEKGKNLASDLVAKLHEDCQYETISYDALTNNALPFEIGKGEDLSLGEAVELFETGKRADLEQKKLRDNLMKVDITR